MNKVILSVSGRFTAKDQLKADIATRFIGRGSPHSSTNRYAADFGPLANSGSYKPSDRVFVSVEGNRLGRLKFDASEIDKAVAASASFVTDNDYHTNRSYNIGERELAAYLLSKGYSKNKFANYNLWLKTGSSK